MNFRREVQNDTGTYDLVARPLATCHNAHIIMFYVLSWSRFTPVTSIFSNTYSYKPERSQHFVLKAFSKPYKRERIPRFK